MAAIDNIPLTMAEMPILTTYEPGKLWNPPEGVEATTADWHVVLRAQLTLAEDDYEAQFDKAVDAFVKARRETILLQAFCANLIQSALAWGKSAGVAVETEQGLELSHPLLIHIDTLFTEYQRLGGAPIGETEGFRAWHTELRKSQAEAATHTPTAGGHPSNPPQS
jgi:hypothetical protein